MPIYDHVLEACAPVPLAGYLKALGVLRLVAEQKDENARGFWRNERFVLKTELNEEELMRFFVEEWQPTPVVAPWNSGSGFWPSDNHEGFDTIKSSNIPRLAVYRDAIYECEKLIRDLHFGDKGETDDDKETKPKKDKKSKGYFISALRANLSENACRWLDGAITLTIDGPHYPPVLGTGGNDGRLDFSNNYMRQITKAIRAQIDVSQETLRTALFSEPSAKFENGKMGQFAPGNAGGANAGIGFENGISYQSLGFRIDCGRGIDLCIGRRAPSRARSRQCICLSIYHPHGWCRYERCRLRRRGTVARRVLDTALVARGNIGRSRTSDVGGARGGE